LHVTTRRPSKGRAPAAQRVRRIRALLLDWYDRSGEPFPWRDARDPYWALVAGVCSQQTQMSRVLPLWERWIAAFPTVEAAANASRAAVLRAWGDAGYPRRAANLHEAARRCMADHGGRVPRSEAELLALPGVGPFTAAIVRCFGYGDDAVAVDTNVVRVLGRVAHGDLQPALETPRAAIEATAARLLPPGEAARWNPALMDYGARVCLPRPRCERCALARLCAARPRFARGERATPLRAQPPFEGSRRQWRGRILRALRENDAPVSTSALLRSLAPDPASRAAFRELLDELVAGGLVWVRAGRCGLGEPPQAL
jgi:A/G-specific adenine glycosylase